MSTPPRFPKLNVQFNIEVVVVLPQRAALTFVPRPWPALPVAAVAAVTPEGDLAGDVIRPQDHGPAGPALCHVLIHEGVIAEAIPVGAVGRVEPK
jgi:hypothetical protein